APGRPDDAQRVDRPARSTSCSTTRPSSLSSPSAMDRLAGRVAVVTGAGQGIGRGIALLFAREGARVCVAELKAHRAERTVHEIRAAGGEALALVADVGRREDTGRMVEETVQRWGSIDVLVNNAHGFGARAPLEEISEEQFDLSWTSGVKG